MFRFSRLPVLWNTLFILEYFWIYRKSYKPLTPFQFPVKLSPPIPVVHLSQLRKLGSHELNGRLYLNVLVFLLMSLLCSRTYSKAPHSIQSHKSLSLLYCELPEGKVGELMELYSVPHLCTCSIHQRPEAMCATMHNSNKPFSCTNYLSGVCWGLEIQSETGGSSLYPPPQTHKETGHCGRGRWTVQWWESQCDPQLLGV